MNDIIVTDHALVRWLERAHDLDVEQLKAKMAEMARPFIEARVAEAEIGGLWFVFDDKKNHHCQAAAHRAAAAFQARPQIPERHGQAWRQAALEGGAATA